MIEWSKTTLLFLFTLDRGYLRWVSALFQKIIDQNKCISRTLKQNKNPARRQGS